MFNVDNIHITICLIILILASTYTKYDNILKMNFLYSVCNFKIHTLMQTLI